MVRTGYHGVPERLRGGGGWPGVFGLQFEERGDVADCEGLLAQAVILEHERGQTGLDVKTGKGNVGSSGGGHEQVEEEPDCCGEEGQEKAQAQGHVVLL